MNNVWHWTTITKTKAKQGTTLESPKNTVFFFFFVNLGMGLTPSDTMITSLIGVYCPMSTMQQIDSSTFKFQPSEYSIYTHICNKLIIKVSILKYICVMLALGPIEEWWHSKKENKITDM